MRSTAGSLKNHWYAACLVTELAAWRPLARTILGERLVLFRDAAHAPVALSDRCVHRNALLSGGTVSNGCIVCPYHGWTYDSAGQCREIPSEGPQFKPEAGRVLEKFPVCEQDGLCWVWMGGEQAPTHAPFVMPHFNSPGYGKYYMVTPFSNGVTNLVENFMDVPHTVFVHRGWFRSRKLSPVRTTIERTKDSVLVTYHDKNDDIGFSGRILNPRKLPLAHTDKFYMPNNTRVDYIYGDDRRSFVITSTCTPVAPLETMVYTLISYKVGLLNPLAKLLLPWYTRKVIDQDVEIMANQGEALRHYGEEKFSSTAADTMHAYIESLRRFAERGETGEPPKPLTKEVTFWI